MSTRSNPFEELQRLFDRMGQRFEDSSRTWESDGPFGQWTSDMHGMAVDLIDNEDAFVVTVDLPGFEKEDVDVRVTNHTLRIKADHETETEQQGAQYLRQERRHESMHRSLRLPDEVDRDGASARMKNGVLTITLPKRHTEETHMVEIE